MDAYCEIICSCRCTSTNFLQPITYVVAAWSNFDGVPYGSGHEYEVTPAQSLSRTSSQLKTKVMLGKSINARLNGETEA